MRHRRQRRAHPGWWAAGSAVATAGLSVAVNYATDNDASWIAWTAVGLLTVVVASLAYFISARTQNANSVTTGNGSVTESRTEPGSEASEMIVQQGLAVRRRVTTEPDGRKTETTDIYSESVALWFLSSTEGQEGDDE